MAHITIHNDTFVDEGHIFLNDEIVEQSEEHVVNTTTKPRVIRQTRMSVYAYRMEPDPNYYSEDDDETDCICDEIASPVASPNYSSGVDLLRKDSSQVSDRVQNQLKTLNHDCSVNQNHDTPISSLTSKIPTDLPGSPLRSNVIAELKSTEITYLYSLKALHDVYIVAICERGKDLNLKSDEIAIFKAHVEPIVNFHKEFLKSLTQTDPNGHGIANRFLFSVPFLRLYREYTYNYSIVATLIERLKSNNKKFNNFLIKHIETDPRMTGLSIQSLYIMPIQRLPRYKMLLERLLEGYEKDVKCMKELVIAPYGDDIEAAKADSGRLLISDVEMYEFWAKERDLLRKAFNAIQDATQDINNAQVVIESQARLRSIADKVSPKSASELLSHPSRRLVCEANFDREDGGKLKPAQILLCSDVIIWMDNFRFKGAMPLNRICFKACGDEKIYHSKPVTFNTTTCKWSQFFVDISLGPIALVPSTPSRSKPAGSQIWNPNSPPLKAIKTSTNVSNAPPIPKDCLSNMVRFVFKTEQESQQFIELLDSTVSSSTL